MCQVHASDKVRRLPGLTWLETEMRVQEQIWVLKPDVGAQGKGPDLGEALNPWMSAWRQRSHGQLYTRVWPHLIVTVGEDLRGGNGKGGPEQSKPKGSKTG